MTSIVPPTTPDDRRAMPNDDDDVGAEEGRDVIASVVNARGRRVDEEVDDPRRKPHHVAPSPETSSSWTAEDDDDLMYNWVDRRNVIELRLRINGGHKTSLRELSSLQDNWGDVGGLQDEDWEEISRRACGGKWTAVQCRERFAVLAARGSSSSEGQNRSQGMMGSSATVTATATAWDGSVPAVTTGTMAVAAASAAMATNNAQALGCGGVYPVTPPAAVVANPPVSVYPVPVAPDVTRPVAVPVAVSLLPPPTWTLVTGQRQQPPPPPPPPPPPWTVDEDNDLMYNIMDLRRQCVEYAGGKATLESFVANDDVFVDWNEIAKRVGDGRRRDAYQCRIRLDQLRSEAGTGTGVVTVVGDNCRAAEERGHPPPPSTDQSSPPTQEHGRPPRVLTATVSDDATTDDGGCHPRPESSPALPTAASGAGGAPSNKADVSVPTTHGVHCSQKRPRAKPQVSPAPPTPKPLQERKPDDKKFNDTSMMSPWTPLQDNELMITLLEEVNKSLPYKSEGKFLNQLTEDEKETMGKKKVHVNWQTVAWSVGDGRRRTAMQCKDRFEALSNGVGGDGGEPPNAHAVELARFVAVSDGEGKKEGGVPKKRGAAPPRGTTTVGSPPKDDESCDRAAGPGGGTSGTTEISPPSSNDASTTHSPQEYVAATDESRGSSSADVPKVGGGSSTKSHPSADEESSPSSPPNVSMTIEESSGGSSSLVDVPTLPPMPQHLRPEDEGATPTPNSNDALCGRGGAIINHHNGNGKWHGVTPNDVLCGRGGAINAHHNGNGKWHGVTPNDVLCGRGGAINAHEGNIKWRGIIAALKPTYLAATTQRREKAEIAARAVARIREQDPPGRFLCKDCSGEWIEIGDDRARKKAGQALREDAPEIRADVAAANAVVQQKQPQPHLQAQQNDKARTKAGQALREDAPDIGADVATPNAVAQQQQPQKQKQKQQQQPQPQLQAQQNDKARTKAGQAVREDAPEIRADVAAANAVVQQKQPQPQKQKQKQKQQQQPQPQLQAQQNDRARTKAGQALREDAPDIGADVAAANAVAQQQQPQPQKQKQQQQPQPQLQAQQNDKARTKAGQALREDAPDIRADVATADAVAQQQPQPQLQAQRNDRARTKDGQALREDAPDIGADVAAANAVAQQQPQPQPLPQQQLQAQQQGISPRGRRGPYPPPPPQGLPQYRVVPSYMQQQRQQQQLYQQGGIYPSTVAWTPYEDADLIMSLLTLRAKRGAGKHRGVFIPLGQFSKELMCHDWVEVAQCLSWRNNSKGWRGRRSADLCRSRCAELWSEETLGRSPSLLTAEEEEYFVRCLLARRRPRGVGGLRQGARVNGGGFGVADKVGADSGASSSTSSVAAVGKEPNVWMFVKPPSPSAAATQANLQEGSPQTTVCRPPSSTVTESAKGRVLGDGDGGLSEAHNDDSKERLSDREVRNEGKSPAALGQIPLLLRQDGHSSPLARTPTPDANEKKAPEPSNNSSIEANECNRADIADTLRDYARGLLAAASSAGVSGARSWASVVHLNRTGVQASAHSSIQAGDKSRSKGSPLALPAAQLRPQTRRVSSDESSSSSSAVGVHGAGEHEDQRQRLRISSPKRKRELNSSGSDATETFTTKDKHLTTEANRREPTVESLPLKKRYRFRRAHLHEKMRRKRTRSGLPPPVKKLTMSTTGDDENAKHMGQEVFLGGCQGGGDCMDAQWYARFRELREYKRIHGNMDVPEDHPGGLGRWIARQRDMYNKRKTIASDGEVLIEDDNYCAIHGCETPTGTRIALLECLGFDFSWQKNQKADEGSIQHEEEESPASFLTWLQGQNQRGNEQRPIANR